MSPPVLVTGANGHLGAALVRALLAAGRPVRALVYRNDAALVGLDVERFQGDVRDPDALRRALSGCVAVHHLAAFVSLHAWDEASMVSVNVDGARHVAEAARAAGARMIHYSSAYAFHADRTEAVLDESRAYATHPSLPAYDRSKARGSLAVDALVRDGLDAVTLHPTGVLGPFDHGSSHQGRWLRRVAMGRDPALVRGGSDWVDARDVASAGLAAEDPARAPAGEHYLVGGRRAEATELAAHAARALGRRPPRLVLPLRPLRAVAPAVDAVAGLFKLRVPLTRASLHALDTHRAVSSAKAARALDHRPRPLEDTVRDMMEWYRERGMLR